MMRTSANRPYRGRIAPSPTGYLHLGHARTFWTAFDRCRQAGGTLVFRNEDLDPARSRPEFLEAMFEDLQWFGITWQEGPDIGGPFAPYEQSACRPRYLEIWRKLLDADLIYPCHCSRKEIQSVAAAPQAGDEEPIYPGTCRSLPFNKPDEPGGVHWRFRVPDRREIQFDDEAQGLLRFVCGETFGDFVIWRKDDVPAYQLAVVADDHAMEITEVVRGADLLVSTGRQLLLYEAMGWEPPRFFHCPLVYDERGVRLAKRHASLSLRELRRLGWLPEDLRNLSQLPLASPPGAGTTASPGAQ